MPQTGQSSGGWLESSSALRILHVGVRNTVSVLTASAFTQTNPPTITDTDALSTSKGFHSNTFGVLSGSVAFTRGDQGPDEIGGPAPDGGTGNVAGVVPLGVFINTAAGNAFENQPGVASDKGPYVSAQGCYGNQLFETQDLTGAFADLTYTTGDALYASLNGYLTNFVDDEYNHAGANNAWAADLVIAVLKMPADSAQPEIIYDQRI